MTQSSIPSTGAATSAPTPDADLNAVLAELVGRARAVLGEAFVGAWLQGSFALGDADQASDVDFMIATDGDLSAAQIAALNVMHAELFALPSPWAQRLDGSYAPAAILRHLERQPRDPPGEPRADDWTDPGIGGEPPPRVYPFLYLNNGSKTLMRSEHDNTEVVRWTLREAGVTLAGPPARDLIDPVSTEALKAEVRRILDLVLRVVLDENLALEQLWLQVFFVGFACRTLHTLAAGRVTSKKAAAAWGAEHLGERWRPLIKAASEDYRALPLDVRLGPADPAAVEETRAFLRVVRTKAILERAIAAKRHGARAPDWRGDGRGQGGPHGRPPRGGPVRPGGLGRKTQGG